MPYDGAKRSANDPFDEAAADEPLEQTCLAVDLFDATFDKPVVAERMKTYHIADPSLESHHAVEPAVAAARHAAACSAAAGFHQWPDSSL